MRLDSMGRCALGGVLLAIFAATARAQAPSPSDFSCPPDAPRLMVLGSYHMDNPGQDARNIEADDVLTPKRQKQIAEVLDRLAPFAPTKVAIEGAFVGSTWPARYLSYRKGEYKLGRNEIEQIGLRLAERMNLARVHPVDFAMWMDGRVPAEIGEARPRPSPSPSAPAEPETPRSVPEVFREMEALVTGGKATVLEILRYANSERFMREDHATYIRGLRPDPYSNELYGATNPVTNWYKRNLRIFTNLYRISEPGDRILLLIGSGHLSILRRLAIDAPDVCLVDAETYLK